MVKRSRNVGLLFFGFLAVAYATFQINDLRKLYSTFGQLFCHSVTLGGCLQTTKTVTGTDQMSESQQKQKFKAEVGVAVSTVRRLPRSG